MDAYYNWSSAVLDGNETRTFVGQLANMPGIKPGTLTIFVANNAGYPRLFYCPSASDLSSISDTCSGAAQINTSSESVSPMQINGLSYFALSGYGSGGYGVFAVPAPPTTGGGSSGSNAGSNGGATGSGTTGTLSSSANFTSTVLGASTTTTPKPTTTSSNSGSTKPRVLGALTQTGAEAAGVSALALMLIIVSFLVIKRHKNPLLD